MLKDLASSPSITGLPGLVFAPDVDGCILDLMHAGVLRLIVNDPKSTDSKDRFIAALRIGVWFQHCLKIAMRSPHVKRTDSSFYILVRNSVRSEYEIVATHSEYSWRKLKAMIFVFEQARLRFRKDEVSTQSPDADSSVIDIETAFLKPIDLWVDLNKAVKHAGPRAEAFVQTPGWVANILAEYKNKTGIGRLLLLRKHLVQNADGFRRLHGSAPLEDPSCCRACGGPMGHSQLEAFPHSRRQ
jgi:hypothetical protein